MKCQIIKENYNKVRETWNSLLIPTQRAVIAICEKDNYKLVLETFGDILFIDTDGKEYDNDSILELKEDIIHDTLNEKGTMWNNNWFNLEFLVDDIVFDGWICEFEPKNEDDLSGLMKDALNDYISGYKKSNIKEIE